MLSGPAGQSMHAARVSSSAQDRAQAFCPSSPALSSGTGLTQLTCTDHVSTEMLNQIQQPQSVVTNGASLEMLFLILTYTGVKRGTHTLIWYPLLGAVLTGSSVLFWQKPRFEQA